MTGTVEPSAIVTVPAAPPRSARRWRLVVVVAVTLAVVALLAVSGLNRTLVYYRNPTELMHDHTLVGKQVRVGGLVQPGTLHRDGQTVTFTLTDGATDVPVSFTGPINGVFAAGRDALVDGKLTAAGTFDGDQLMVKHDNSYRGPDNTPYTPPPVDGTGR